MKCPPDTIKDICWVQSVKYLVYGGEVVVYAVKVKRSLAPLSQFRGSHIPSAHEQECCRFQSYANSVRSPMKFTSEIYIA